MKTLLALLALSMMLACDSEDGVVAQPDAQTGSDADAGSGADSEADAEADAPADTEPDAEPEPSVLDFTFDEDGPYLAGYRTFEVTYDPLGGPEGRSILVHVWYPATETTEDHPSYVNLFEDLDSHEGAPVAPPVDGVAHPALVHSHGHRGFAGNSAFLMRRFATQGWVAIAPDHTGNTLIDNIDPRPAWMYYTRSLDISEALDAVGGLPAGDALAGIVALERVVLSGHSFGVPTVWASCGATYDLEAIGAGCDDGSYGEAGCSEDELAAFGAGVGDDRIIAGIPMAGSLRASLFGDEGHLGVGVPILAMSGSEDPVGADTQFDLVSSFVDITWIDIEGGCHQTFGLGEPCSTIDIPLGFDIVSAYAMAFSRLHLLDDQAMAGVMDGTVEVSPLVTLKASTPR